MQSNDMAEKKRVIIDGEELPGLVFAGELSLEKGSIEVPEFKKIRVIQNGVSKTPPQELRYKIARGTNTLKFIKDWYFNDEVKDVTIIRTDAHGVEFGRTLLPQCECFQYTEPETDAASPNYAQSTIVLLPWDVIPLDAE